ncbi:RCC1 repeat-containing protein [Candidatus Magnetomorum sp. HK-1]|nr:RCC1 repeat-containing protein [Candidatus Magnetomorum sp. HK-1]
MYKISFNKNLIGLFLLLTLFFYGNTCSYAAVPSIAAGGSHTLALMEDGTVWAWGYNEYGQLGDYSTENKTIPVQVKDLNDVTAIAAGTDHSLALKQDGTVWAWGWNKYGQLGDTSTSNKSIPVQVKDLNNVTAINAGFGHSLALKQDGTVWAWGRNDYGQLGDSSTTNKSIPVQVKDIDDVTAIAPGYYHSLALKQDGTVWAWGWNYFGQLGDSSTENKSIPVQVKDLSDVTFIAAAGYHSLALKQEGTVWAWGDNGNGQLGDSSTEDKSKPVKVKDLNGVIAIAAGLSHSLALKQDGTAWAWGKNKYGQLGDSSTENKSIPVQVKDLNDITAIAAGSGHSLALKKDGTVWAWGYNESGQLGDSSTSSKSIPVQVKNLNDITAIAADIHSLALKKDGTVWAWGRNENYQLGDGTTNDRSTPVQMKNLSNVSNIAAGISHTLLLKEDATVWGLGNNSFGQLGIGLSITQTKGPDGQGVLKLFHKPLTVCSSNCDYTSIQLAIDAASFSDTVFVSDGTYYETLDFQGKAIRIESIHGSNATTIDAKNSGSVVRFAHQETNTSILKGFTLKNGLSDFGGGIFVDNASPVIENCRIINNQADSGGGLYLTNGASPQLSNCAINVNIASNGAGVFIDNSNIHFSQTTIKFNKAAQNGGGIFLNASSPDIDQIIIQGNHAARGAGIYIAQNSLPQITRSQLSENSASESGGGACIIQQSELNIVNSLIFGNSANFNGGGFYVNDSELKIHSSSLVHQYASFGRSVFADTAKLTICNSILWNNGEEIEDYDSLIAVYHSDIQLNDGIFPGEGNINEDPNFRDPLSDFGLNSTSPCIDAGTFIDAPATDLSGKIRPSGDTPDIGAYEWNNQKPTAYFYAINATVYAGIAVKFIDQSYSYDGIQAWQWDFGDGETSSDENPSHTYNHSGYYSVTLEVISAGGTSETLRTDYIHVFESVKTFYVNASGGQNRYTSIQSAIDLSNVGDTIIVEPGTYYESIDFEGKGITIKSSHGTEQTTIDANNLDSVVKCINGENSGAILKGFSLTNGSANYGGGIYINGASSPTIIDCIIFNNHAQKEGGGIAAAYSSMPMIIDCEIKQNTARNGAGIACLNSSSASLRNTRITENQALKNGGGMYVYYKSLPEINVCEISNNIALSLGGGVYGFGAAPKLIASQVHHNMAENGGGIMLHDALSPLIEKTMIRENTATTGGALYLLNTSSPEILNSVIVDNQAAYGGGLYLKDVSTLLINYSTLANNMAYSEGSAIYGSNVSEFVFRNSILWHDGNEIVLAESDVPTVDFSNIRQLKGIFSGTGNINKDPIFSGPKDYRLGLGSPCKNMGNATNAPAQDIVGVKRPVGNGFDIGAYEALNVPPVTSGRSLTTNEDISLNIQLIAEDDDDDPLIYLIEEQPNHGIITGEGANITYNPKANYSGSDFFRFKTKDSYYDSNISSVNITIIAIADAPVLNLSSTTQGYEDIEIPIPVNTVLSDTDGSEVSSPVIIRNVPEQAVLSQGIKNSDGSYTLTTDQLSDLRLLPALHNSDDITLTVQITSTETSNNDSVTITNSIYVDIILVADRPELLVKPNIAVIEDTPIQLTISSPSLVDQDQSEILSDLTLFNIPDHAVLSDGTQNADGTWTLRPEQLPSLTLTPGKNIAHDFTFTVSVTATETENSDTAAATQTISVDIIPVADKPILEVRSYVSGNEDTAIQLTITPPSLVDKDQSEILSDITISQVPDHAVLSAGTKNDDDSWTLTKEQLASLTITPGLNEINDFTVIVSVVSTETENSDSALTTKTIAVDIIPVNDLPTISTIDDQEIKENASTSPIRFTIADVETGAENLILSVNSSNTELISQSRIFLERAGVERSVVFSPEPGKYGFSTITISVEDESNGLSETSFILKVQNVVRPGDFNDNGLIELIDSQIALNILAGNDSGTF